MGHIITTSTVSEIGNAVRRDRKRRGMTQAKLASLCGVGQRFISDLENGKPTMEIGKVLEVVLSLGFIIRLEK